MQPTKRNALLCVVVGAPLGYVVAEYTNRPVALALYVGVVTWFVSILRGPSPLSPDRDTPGDANEHAPEDAPRKAARRERRGGLATSAPRGFLGAAEPAEWISAVFRCVPCRPQRHALDVG